MPSPIAITGSEWQSIFVESAPHPEAQSGVMTVMFTHKETGAWDALTKGLIDARFVITASWPVRSLHWKVGCI